MIKRISLWWHVVIASALAVYYGCMVIPLSDVTSAAVGLQPSVLQGIRNWQFAGLGMLSAFCGAAFVSSAVRGRFNPKALLLWLPFVGWCICSTAWSINPSASALYGVFIPIMLACGAIIWLLPNDTTRLAARLAALAIVLGVAWLGTKLTIGLRTLGGISPNLIAHFGLAALVFSYMGSRRLRLIGAVAGGALIVFAQGRTVLISTAIFLIFYHLITSNIRDRRSLVTVSTAALAASIFLALLAPTLVDLVSQAASNLLGVKGADRGGGSGFSGRANLWSTGLSLLQGHELNGYGFRSRTTTDVSAAGSSLNAHSGVLNALLDIGIIGVLLYLTVYATSTWWCLRAWATTRSDTARISACFLIAFVPTMAVEPLYLSFAHPTAFLALFCLANPLAQREAVDCGSTATRIIKPLRRYGQARRGLASSGSGSAVDIIAPLGAPQGGERG